MASFNSIGAMLGLKKPKVTLPDYTSLLTSAPKGTAASDVEAAKKRTAARLRSDKALLAPRSTILTGAMGTGAAKAPEPKKATIGGGLS